MPVSPHEFSGLYAYVRNTPLNDADTSGLIGYGAMAAGGMAAAQGKAGGGFQIVSGDRGPLQPGAMRPVEQLRARAAGQQPAAEPTPPPVDANRLHHIFGQTRHNLSPLINQHGSEMAAYSAVQNAAQQAAQARGLQGVVEIPVQVGQHVVTVRGRVVDGILRIATFFIP